MRNHLKRVLLYSLMYPTVTTVARGPTQAAWWSPWGAVVTVGPIRL